MPENDGPVGEQPSREGGGDGGAAGETVRPVVTRRDFIAGAGLGVAATAAVAGGVAIATRPQTATTPLQTAPGGPVVQVPAPAPPVAAPTQAPAQAAGQAATPAQAEAQPTDLPRHMRRVTLNIDGTDHSVVVDVRESLWTTATQKLGLNLTNLGCDRAQCGACAVLVDGRAVNGCTVLSARMGRGQKIVTVAGIQSGPGTEGLHPVQRAFWMQGGFQCGICTRGFIMSSYALLQSNTNPTRAQIAEALSGNICRCGEYPKIFVAVEAAAAELRNPPARPQILLGPPPARSGRPSSMQFTFVNPLGSGEFIAEVDAELKGLEGVDGVTGNELTATVTFWPQEVTEEQIRKQFADTGYPVK